VGEDTIIENLLMVIFLYRFGKRKGTIDLEIKDLNVLSAEFYEKFKKVCKVWGLLPRLVRSSLKLYNQSNFEERFDSLCAVVDRVRNGYFHALEDLVQDIKLFFNTITTLVESYRKRVCYG
jgi:hypothetical protein